MIEAVNDILMSVCDTDHTRHRNPANALGQIISSLTTYTFLDHQKLTGNSARLCS